MASLSENARIPMTILVNGQILETDSEFVRKIIAQCRYKSDSKHSVAMIKGIFFCNLFQEIIRYINKRELSI